jgi:hypothetical protein
LCRMALGVVWRHGAQCLRFDSCLGESRPYHTSWWLLCLSRGGFEGGCAGVLARSSSVRQLEGLADGGSGAVQRSAWRRPVSSGSHGVGDGHAVLEIVAQRRGWPHRAGVTEEMRSIIIRHGDVLDGHQVDGSTPLEGITVLLRGVWHGKGREWAVLCHRVTPAIPHSTGTTPWMAAQWRVGRTAPGSDSQAVSGSWRDGDSLLTRAPAVCQSIYCPGRRSRWDTAGRGRPRARWGPT